jgi:2-polyprenyl-6-methoxyphenol hydroxylase-like FAD-dependent oxidoreductase
MDVLISGAGVAGPALAFWLARAGMRPVVVERTPALRLGGHAIDVRGAAVDVVEQMGLLAAIRAARTQLKTLSFVRAPEKSPIEVDIPRAQPSGTRDVEIVRDDLVRILYDATKSEAEYLFGDAIAAIVDADSQVSVTFASGTVRQFDFVVGADGQHSATRRLVFGDEDAFTHRIGAYLAIFSLPNLLGLQDRAMLYNEPGHAVAYYTVAGNERAKALLSYRSHARIDLQDESALKAALRERFRRVGWESGRILDAMDASPDFYFDEIAQIRMPKWSSGRVVLLGDAAHGPSPLSGQGTTLALVGARVLAGALAAHSEPRSAFAAYERRMRPFVQRNQALASGGLGLLIPASRFSIGVRNAAMRLFPLLLRLGIGFGKKLEAASRAIELPA